MEKITYLLGAGASAQCLPVVNKMAEDILETSGLFRSKFALPRVIIGSAEHQHNIKIKEIEDELSWLSKICKTHYSVDTYAKKLFIKGEDEEYNKLKNILSIYFTIKQKLTPADKRYDNFWASILETKDNFPENLRIISWNYDSQLELSYKNFVSSNISLEEVYGRIKMSSYHDTRLSECDCFSIFKLNGSAKTFKKKQGRNHSKYLVDNLNIEEKTDFFEKLYHLYTVMKPNQMKTAEESTNNELSFAWEHNYSYEYYDNMKKSLLSTTVLVVIGYSFPFFNRKLDRLIINEYMPNLHKVYFQAPDAENLKERFVAITDRIPDYNMLLRRDENQFTFPNELDI